jgi:hypothetical protein
VALDRREMCMIILRTQDLSCDLERQARGLIVELILAADSERTEVRRKVKSDAKFTFPKFLSAFSTPPHL